MTDENKQITIPIPTKSSTPTIVTVLVVALCIVLGFGLLFYAKYNKAVTALADTTAVLKQNRLYYEFIMKQQYEGHQLLAVKIDNLNDSLTSEQKKKRYWKATAELLSLKVDSLHNSGTGIAYTGEDSSGKYGQVSFKGKEGITSYEGFTKYWYNPDVPPLYNIDIYHDQIMVKSYLYCDVDSVWKIYTESLSPDVKLKAEYAIDRSIYVGLRSSVEDLQSIAYRFANPMGIRLKGNVGARLGKDDLTKLKNVFFLDGSVEWYYDYWNFTYYPFQSSISAGVFYQFDINDLLKIIF